MQPIQPVSLSTEKIKSERVREGVGGGGEEKEEKTPYQPRGRDETDRV